MIPVITAAAMAQGAGGKSIEDIDSDIQKERAMQIDATCVRIMKGRKVEKHQTLIQSIVHQITLFHAQPPMIKKRIESLIEREYLERDP